MQEVFNLPLTLPFDTNQAQQARTYLTHFAAGRYTAEEAARWLEDWTPGLLATMNAYDLLMERCEKLKADEARMDHLEGYNVTVRGERDREGDDIIIDHCGLYGFSGSLREAIDKDIAALDDLLSNPKPPEIDIVEAFELLRKEVNGAFDHIDDPVAYIAELREKGADE